MADLFQQTQEAATFISTRSALRPALAIVLGSGLGDFADDAADAFAGDSMEVAHVVQGELFLLRRPNDGAGQGMLARLFQTGEQPQHFHILMS